MSYHFMYILYKVNFQRAKRVPKQAQVFIFKCILHCINSVAALAITDLATGDFTLVQLHSYRIQMLSITSYIPL